MSISPFFTTRRKFSFTKYSCNIPVIKLPKLDRQQAINIPYSFTKVYLPSCLSDMVWTREKLQHDTDKTQSCNNICLNEPWQRNSSFDVCCRKWLHCTVVVFFRLRFPQLSILSFIVWWAHPVLISPSKCLNNRLKIWYMYILIRLWRFRGSNTGVSMKLTLH